MIPCVKLAVHIEPSIISMTIYGSVKQFVYIVEQ